MSPSPSLEALRAHVRRVERGGRPPAPTRPLGVPAVDAALPWGGLPLGCLHQVVAGPDAFDGAATAFAGILAARTSEGRGPVLWCLEDGRDDTVHAPGLATLGLPPGRLLLVRGRDGAAVLWSMEEGLRCPALGAVVGQVDRMDLTAARRLQLASEAGGATGVVLGRLGRDADRDPLLDPLADVRPAGSAPGAATTRWRLWTLPSHPPPWGGPGPARWRVALERCRGGTPRTWTLEWNDETGDLSVATDLPDRPGDPTGGDPGGPA
jgi:protein ImuA